LTCGAKSWSIAEVRRGENFVHELNERTLATKDTKFTKDTKEEIKTIGLGAKSWSIAEVRRGENFVRELRELKRI
jgi:hypothetical protein